MSLSLAVIADLMSDDATNTEYDRACVEIACAFLGQSTEARDTVEGVLRGIKTGDITFAADPSVAGPGESFLVRNHDGDLVLATVNTAVSLAAPIDTALSWTKAV